MGKFVTSSNDYFFQPAVAIIYLVFVAVFLGFRTIERAGRLTERELLANAYDEAVEVALHPADEAHRARALRLLRASGASGPLTQGLERALVEQGPHHLPAPATRASRRERARWAMTRAYERAVASRWFPRVLVLLVAAYAFLFLLLFGLELVAAIEATTLAGGPGFALDLFALRGHRVVQVGLLVSSLVAASCVVIGLAALVRDRPRAYRWFKRSTLVSLLLGQVFLFYTQQFGALVELVLSLIALGGLNAMLAAERRARRLTTRSLVGEWDDVDPGT